MGLCPADPLRRSPGAAVNSWIVSLLVGTATGILSGLGVGGGSLLLVWMTAFAGLDQHTAQGINLLYFLPAAAAALPGHQKAGLIDRKSAVPAILAGLVSAGLCAWLSAGLDTALLRRCFGLFLLFIGFSELFSKK